VVHLKLGAKQLKKRKLTAMTVADVLKSADFEVDRHDKVRPSLTTEIADGDKIVVTDIRVATKKVKREVLDAPVVEREDSSMFEGEQEVVRAGRDGVIDRHSVADQSVEVGDHDDSVEDGNTEQRNKADRGRNAQELA